MHATTPWTLLKTGLVALTLAVLTACGGDTEKTEVPLAKNTFVIENVKVFDGSAIIDKANVVVTEGRVSALGEKAKGPKGAPVVDGTGKTLFPGLIDAHTHTFSPAALADAARYGVTTELDMFTAVQFFQGVKGDREALTDTGRADMFSAGTLVTSEGGHGTQYGLPIPVIAGPEEAQAFVDARIEEGSDYIKIIYEPGRETFKSITAETLAAVVEAAHARGKIAVVHISKNSSAREAAEAGADGLVHAFGDEPISDDLVALMAEKNMFMVPTLSVMAGITDPEAGPAIAADADLAPFLAQEQITGLKANFQLSEDFAKAFDLSVASDAVLKLHQAGVTVLAGTDAPNPGTAHGVSMHGELAHLVNAGMTPVEALTAATSATAARFDMLGSRGKIAEGTRADFVLVSGDPTVNILDTRKIAGVWKNGFEIDRPRFGDEAANKPEVAKPELTDGLVSNFDFGLTSSFGVPWQVTSDQIAGGASSASVAQSASGADGSKGALQVFGEIDTKFPFPWAGAGVFFFGQGQMPGPYDLSDYQSLTFMARGDARAYSVMMFSRDNPQQPAIQTVTLTAEWQPYTLDLAGFQGVALDEVFGIAFTAGQPEGSFQFELDNVALK